MKVWWVKRRKTWKRIMNNLKYEANEVVTGFQLHVGVFGLSPKHLGHG